MQHWSPTRHLVVGSSVQEIGLYNDSEFLDSGSSIKQSMQKNLPYKSSYSASYKQQVDDRREGVSTHDTMSYSQIHHIKQLLQVYCDLGIQPHNFSSQSLTISLSDNNAIYGINSFSYNFSQGSSHDIGSYDSKDTCIHQHSLINTNKDITQSTDTIQSLVKQQDEWPRREYGFITDCILKSEILPVVPEIELKNDQQWLRQIHANITKYELPNYKGARGGFHERSQT